jgi:hypothetical protein
MATTQSPLIEAILTGGLPASKMACGARAGVRDDGGERAATPAAVVAAAAGRGGVEAPAGGNNI